MPQNSFENLDLKLQKKESKTLFIAIAFGTSIRDVLRNDTYKKLLERDDLKIVIFAQDIDNDFKSEFGLANQVEFVNLKPIRPTFTERVLLQFHRAVLRDKCRTIDLGNTSGDTSTLNMFTPLSRIIKFFMGFKRTNKIIFKLYKLFAPRTDYKEEFLRFKPDLVVVTRVLNYSADYGVMRTANTLKVPVIALVSSWDNLTSKAFFPFSLQRLVVWNEIIRDEAINLFNFPAKQIDITGIPRYDLFFKKSGFRSKLEFLKNRNIENNKKIITYATGSRTTGVTSIDLTTPEPKIALFIAKAVDKGIFGNAQLVVRLHPQADPDAYTILHDYKNVIIDIPGTKKSFQDRVFSSQEDVDFGELMMYSDVVINLASTVTIDAAVFNTPIVCINFDMNGKRPFKTSVRRFYEFDHYAKLQTTGGFSLANSKEELLSLIQSYLYNPDLHKEGRTKIVQQQCCHTSGNSGELTANVILKELFSKTDI